MSSPNALPPSSPSLPWRLTSSVIMGLTGSLSRGFYYGLNKVEVFGLDGFLQTLDRRKDVEGRERGLITGIYLLGSLRNCRFADRILLNSIESCQRVRATFNIHFANVMLTVYACRIDDPLIWGVLPMHYAFNPSNHRWSLGSYDICFQNRYAILLRP